jgi:hypothetical protein
MKILDLEIKTASKYSSFFLKPKSFFHRAFDSPLIQFIIKDKIFPFSFQRLSYVNKPLRYTFVLVLSDFIISYLLSVQHKIVFVVLSPLFSRFLYFDWITFENEIFAYSFSIHCFRQSKRKIRLVIRLRDSTYNFFKDDQEDDIKDEDIKAAKRRDDFLTKIALECSEEAKLDLDVADKLLLGDISDKSNEAKVRKK